MRGTRAKSVGEKKASRQDLGGAGGGEGGPGAWRKRPAPQAEQAQARQDSGHGAPDQREA